MHRIENEIRNYAWGSHRVLAEFTDRPSPSQEPEAELWLGAHPSAPSRLVDVDGTPTLADAISSDPTFHLGNDLVAEYDNRLPFLFKILAAERPLSIQAHPSHGQAKSGCAAEEELGISRDDPKRNYKDPFAKPEVFVALTESEVLCGFRRSGQAANLLSKLGVSTLAPYVGSLLASRASEGLRLAVTTLLSMPEGKQAALADEVAAESARLAASPSVDPADARAYTWVVKLHEAYPGDIGCVLSLLMNLVVLAPGEAVYSGPGVPHAHLHGSGLEAQGNSDNTLRGGLTPKHVDIAELLRVLDFEPLDEPIVHPKKLGDDSTYCPGANHWPTPAREFALFSWDLDGDGERDLRVAGPQILLCLDGTVTLTSSRGELVLTRGQSAYVAAGDPRVRASGTGRLAQIAAGQVPRNR